ncbi:MAG: hypothetical protein D6753_03255 [Planctomycetota bacterium]|nr:MAG: hypothetical protein D6753_03255 [Planctomycetota bacterium]
MQRVRRIDVIEQGQPLRFEDANSGRIQLYTTVADVFDLYATLVDSPHWDDFRFLRHWDVLEDAAKRREYDAHGCHELDLFLYFKDRPFFDAVVAPVLRNKLEKRLVDRWLLGQDIAPYAELWRMRRLNAVERMLLSRRVPALAAGTRRFLAEWSDAHPVSPEREQQLFEFALLRSQLAAPGMAGNMMGGEAGYGGMGGSGWSGLGDAMRLDEDAAAMAPAAPVPGRADANQERKMEELRLGRAAQPMEEVEGLFFGADRRALGQGRGRQLFRSLDQTREWAESNYYRLKLDQESSELVRPNAFWLEVFDGGTGPILPRHMHLPVNNFHEALLALAFIDLPFSAQPPHIEMQDGAATIECSSDAILLSERYEAADGATAENAPPIMVGHEIYLAEDDPQTARPVTERPLVRGVAYRSNVVISNPTAMPVVVDVLLQIPQGALPLEGTKAVRSVSIPLGPYETRQIEGAFYFPASGEFSMYGAQVSIAGRHVRGAPGRAVRVLDAPVIEDQDSWEYVADWAPPQRVLEFLRQANLHQIDLARMAFRMEDREFYNSALQILEQSGVFDAALWAYAVRHDDPPRIEQLLQHNEPFLQRLGSHLDSPLLQIIPEQRGWYEYLEYRPLVVARAHRLGAQREILNNRLREQYLRLMRVLAHQAVIAPAQRLQLSYYMLLQNRIAEAIQHFGRVDRQTIEPVASYDYMDAYLAMYRGDYERAGRLADAYSDHPSPRQRAMFAQVRMQLDQRRALLEGTELAAATELGMDPASRALTNQREVQQAEMARRNPALELEQSGGRLIAHLHNVEQIQIGFYEMDVELLFSRRPFATTQDAAAPIVQPNHRVEVDTIGQESLVIDIPPQLQHKNLIVEVQAAGIARRQLVTAGQLRVVLVEPYGRLQVTDARGGQPVVGAYVKVYARHRDGSEKFFKDGYTDLRGQFDYATLSTGDLDSVEEFSILVLDEELGPSIHQARPPAR